MNAQRRFAHNERSTGSDRIHFVLIAMSVFAGIIGMRVFFLSVIQHGNYVELAQAQHALEQTIQPVRGTIFTTSQIDASKKIPIASNRTYGLLYAVPEDVINKEQTADALIGVLPDLKKDDIVAKMNKPKDLYEELAHKLSEEQRTTIDKLNLKGIYITDEQVRYYPENSIGAQMIGFVGFKGDDRIGQYGIEGAMEKYLAGQKGYVKADRDTGGRWIVTGTQEFKDAQDGSNLVLTVDDTIQFTACTKLDEAVKKHGADSGSVIIMNPTTGAILAMCTSPSFNPNEYNKVDSISIYENQVVTGAYEPGSVFKGLTMSAAINEGKVTPDTTYEDSGEEKIASFTIRNSDGKANGIQTMTQVLEKSLNTGAIFAMRQLGPKLFTTYVQKYGFGEKTGVDVQGEAAGNISNLKLPGEIFSATASFGQGITVTPLQLVAAYAAIANGGQLLKPYIIQEIDHPDGKKDVTQPQTVRQVISSDTASTIGAMLVNVVENGHGTRAGVEGYWVAGKTGTAQVKSTSGGGYDPSATIGTFAGFAPVSNPVFAMVVRIDHPRDVTYAESSAAPLFGDIAKFLLHYLQIAPDRVQ